DVDAQPADHADVDRGRHEDRQHHLQLPYFDKRLVDAARPCKYGGKVDRRGDADQNADDEGEITRLRAILRPLRTEPQAVVYGRGASQKKEHRNDDLGAFLAKRGPPLLLALHASPRAEATS